MQTDISQGTLNADRYALTAEPSDSSRVSQRVQLRSNKYILEELQHSSETQLGSKGSASCLCQKTASEECQPRCETTELELSAAQRSRQHMKALHEKTGSFD